MAACKGFLNLFCRCCIQCSRCYRFDLRLFDVVLLQMQAATYSVLHVRSCADSWRHSAFTIAVTLIARASKSESVARVTQLSKVRAEPPLVGVRKAKGASSLKTFSRDLQTLRMDRSGALACLSYLWDQAPLHAMGQLGAHFIFPLSSEFVFLHPI